MAPHGGPRRRRAGRERARAPAPVRGRTPGELRRRSRRRLAVRPTRSRRASPDESDVDVLVVTRAERDDEALIPTLWSVLAQMGNPRIVVDPRQRSRAWVEDRRAIDSFFLRDVDRDKIVLYGDP